MGYEEERSRSPPPSHAVHYSQTMVQDAVRRTSVGSGFSTQSVVKQGGFRNTRSMRPAEQAQEHIFNCEKRAMAVEDKDGDRRLAE